MKVKAKRYDRVREVATKIDSEVEIMDKTQKKKTRKFLDLYFSQTNSFTRPEFESNEGMSNLSPFCKANSLQRESCCKKS